MSPKSAAKSKISEQKKTHVESQPVLAIHRQVCILLGLWDLKTRDQAIAEKNLPNPAKSHKSVFDQLVAEGAIELSDPKKPKRSKLVSISDKGIQKLDELLKGDIHFASQVGEATANALLNWMRKEGSLVSLTQTNGKAVVETIASYDEFKQVALDVYDRLNRDYNMDNLVPIYRIRREIGDRVSRLEFNEWLLEMQSQDAWQLIGGEMPDITPDRAEDSVKTALGGVRYYAKRL